ESYQKAADLGNVFGILQLGYCFQHGIGTNIIKKKAFELYQKAADLGNASGMSQLGYCYQYGVGTIANKIRAFEIYEKASKYNSAAQFNLALMYEKGDGIKKDIDRAIYWYKKSAEQKYNHAQDKVKKLCKIKNRRRRSNSCKLS